MMDASTADSNELLPPACEQAMAGSLLLSENGELSAAEKAALEKHLAECAACRTRQDEMAQTRQALQGAFQAAQAAPDFVARTMARLPGAPVAAAPAPRSPGARIFTAPPSRHWMLTKTRLAAAFVIGLAGAAIAVLLLAQERALAVPVMKGLVTDSSGQPVKTLRAGQPYRVQQTTVLTLNQTTNIKAQSGAEFTLKAAAGQQTAGFALSTGDIYASNQNASAPLHVECTQFDTELHGGDFFVAQEAAGVSYGIVIAFEGDALVTPQQKPSVPVGAGQVFVSVDAEGLSFFDTFDLKLLQGMEDQLGIAPQAAGLRTEYRTRVEGYQKDKAALQKELAGAPPGSPLHGDLDDRYRRVTQYLEAHQRRLESMTQTKTNEQIPFEEIKRGVNGHTDPKTWL